MTNPLGAIIAGAFTAMERQPIPLIGTSFDVTIDSGLASVTTERRFRNDEPQSIEATITFPVPVHAILYHLEARIDGRVLKAKAVRQAEARQNYEGAIERGKAAILHEEVLRGVHMLSVGHIPPGAEIEVITIWAKTLDVVDGRGWLRIPLAVGDIYGRSNIADSDALVHGGPIQTAHLTVRVRDGQAQLMGGQLTVGQASIPLNAPIDLEISNWTARELFGRAADGRPVSLRLGTMENANHSLDIALLIDHSSSMQGRCAGDGRPTTKHKAIISALEMMASGFTNADAIDVWQFNDTLTHVGSTTEMLPRSSVTKLLGQRRVKWDRILKRLSDPAGGTELGGAIQSLISQSTAKDILLLTDGKSHALDVHALARSGRRFTVVLIGEDSLEANVGHLAALTGGEIFVAAGPEIPAFVSAAISSLRHPAGVAQPINKSPQEVRLNRGNVSISARWGTLGSPDKDESLGRAVAAVAASLALPALDAEAAAELARAEGLVTHLTSLILVDDAGGSQDGLATTRKIRLPTPRVSSGFHMMALEEDYRPILACLATPSLPDRSGSDASVSNARYSIKPTRGRRTVDLSGIASRIDWSQESNRLVSGDMSGLDPSIAKTIEQAAKAQIMIDVAPRFGLTPIILIIGLMAAAIASKQRAAKRVAKLVLRGLDPTTLDLLCAALGLDRSDDHSARL